jgi:hypothetical protein
MGDTKEEAEWRAEFKRSGKEHVQSWLEAERYPRAKSEFARRWVDDETLAGRFRENIIVFCGIMGAAGLIAAWPIIKGWLG